MVQESLQNKNGIDFERERSVDLHEIWARPKGDSEVLKRSRGKGGKGQSQRMGLWRRRMKALSMAEKKEVDNPGGNERRKKKNIAKPRFKWEKEVVDLIQGSRKR